MIFGGIKYFDMPETRQVFSSVGRAFTKKVYKVGKFKTKNIMQNITNTIFTTLKNGFIVLTVWVIMLVGVEKGISAERLVSTNNYTSYQHHNLFSFEKILIQEFSPSYRCKKLLKFTAYNISFELCLERYSKVVSPDIVIQVKDVLTESRYERRVPFKSRLSDVYIGTVNNVSTSFVLVNVDDESVDGHFIFDSENFYIEPYRDEKSILDGFYSCIVYTDKDVKRKIEFEVTGVHYLSRTNASWKKHIQKSDPRNSIPIRKLETHVKKDRKRRSVESASCSLHLVADHTFYIHVGKESPAKTISEMVYRIGEADTIFRGTDFNADGVGDNIGFKIAQITIYTSRYSKDYLISDESLNANDFLDTFSLYNFDNVCLATAFTYRDFEGGTLGLAWVASSSVYGGVGGICQKQIRYSSDRKLYSLNTAVVTMLNYGERVLSYEFGLVLTHEYGHNFGSSHDPEDASVCSPSDDNGKYIMYPYASDGSKPNHNKFSTCSIDSMYPVIVNKGSCFVPYTGPSCGNFIVEDGEECDCGSKDTCSYSDTCCTPPGDPGPDPPCTVRRSKGYNCSPRTSRCCNDNCKFIPSSQNYVCNAETECKHNAICDGVSGSCPLNDNKPNKTFCDDGRKICLGGTCAESICTSFSLADCECADSVEHGCLLCCKYKNDSTCLPAYAFGIYKNNISGQILTIKPGLRCNTFLGICDTDGTCHVKGGIDIMDIIFTEETASDIEIWFEDHWFYVLAIIACLLFSVIVFILTKKKKRNVQIDAFRLGRLENFVNSANLAIAHQEQTLKEREEYLDNLVSFIQRGYAQRPVPFVKAIGRLSHLFPTASRSVLAETVKKASHESVAVLLLVGKGYPVRKLVKNPQE